jgi:hypothetical protein
MPDANQGLFVCAFKHNVNQFYSITLRKLHYEKKNLNATRSYSRDKKIARGSPCYSSYCCIKTIGCRPLSFLSKYTKAKA